MYTYTIDSLFKNNEKIIITKSQFDGDYLTSHNHECFEIAYVCSGKGYHVLNGQRTEVTKGDLFLIGINSFHTYEKITDDFSWYNCLFLPSVFDKSAITYDNAQEVLKMSMSSTLEIKNLENSTLCLYNHFAEFDSIFTNMHYEYTNRKPNYQDILTHYLMILFLRVFRTDSKIDNVYRIDYSKLVLEYLSEHSLESHSDIAAIAQSAFLSPRTFRAIFKKNTGTTLNSFIMDVKIDKAKELLANTDLPVLSIMNSVGYNDSKFFYSLFKRKTSTTPAEYRKSIKRKSHSEDNERTPT